ncbi:hypothetical protein DFH08DRAFT_817665 [Mycena albidolilacea]|uniref:Uncharacterized protein n=1 Tax=Mycena albidolilacea TaxID=1033008 RepID=A0AAD6ZI09_9AGAR|nr:hypothetical protein DFH08DRAFT_817665 [Mycena albidolilacea]
MNFELEIEPSATPDFTSYYTTREASLRLLLGILYSADTSVCIDGEKYSTMLDTKKAVAAANATQTVEDLWNAHTPVDSRIEDDPSLIDYCHRLELIAIVPLVILGDISMHPVAHYLPPRLPAPIILPAHEDSGSHLVFPIPQHKVVKEPLEATSTCLMILPMQFPCGTPDPSAHYQTERVPQQNRDEGPAPAVVEDGRVWDVNATKDGKALDVLGSRPSAEVVIKLNAAPLGEREPEEAGQDVEGGGNHSS